ncbi:MAG: hypothetical protein GTO42_02695 [Candidatus Latescibacteria bacterium]|nr:hypothetical protein [Candidatus Latescibacterota bacterium]NIO01046.1 hypothetical protein [Candidatus Latescibacterota bacterium]NIO27445.1 hypothetical protein [Candidatus Latescibacterota bacterium]NIO54967.1 hypothetical protein [Candidatus Latescibacterota bacterium]NIT01056.1 hypothetical protein [Candidatus Latescibacterota bacterium]
MRRAAGFIAVIIVACAYFYAVHKYSPTRNPQNRQEGLPPLAGGPTFVIDGVEWTQVFYWNFSDGMYPDGWSWGQWEAIDGLLTGEDQEGITSVYFFPFTHNGNVVLETKVKLLKGIEGHHAEAHLLTRDSDEIYYESGMTLLADTNHVQLRHMAGKKDYLYQLFPIHKRVHYNDWYVMRFMIYRNEVKAFVNGIPVLPKLESIDEKLPVGVYHEPHVTVAYGVAQFEYVKILVAP